MYVILVPSQKSMFCQRKNVLWLQLILRFIFELRYTSPPDKLIGWLCSKRNDLTKVSGSFQFKQRRAFEFHHLHSVVADVNLTLRANVLQSTKLFKCFYKYGMPHNSLNCDKKWKRKSYYHLSHDHLLADQCCMMRLVTSFALNNWRSPSWFNCTQYVCQLSSSSSEAWSSPRSRYVVSLSYQPHK